MSLLLCFDVIFNLYIFNKSTDETNFYYFIFLPIFSKLILSLYYINKDFYSFKNKKFIYRERKEEDQG